MPAPIPPLFPPLILLAGAAAVILTVERFGAFAFRNLLPLAVTLSLVVWTLADAGWRWRRALRRRILATAGFAVPAVGLSLYLHLGLALDWGGMASRARTPELLFRFLPYYTIGAGCIGFAIGWIIGRNLDEQ